ncbi:MAG: aminotransferase class V-fold PLP-dependent enzyme [Nitrospinae bacterium]|nr:aminotransferase class V-fold PLP-dependent enzyme [Nitrospinota bacterium]
MAHTSIAVPTPTADPVAEAYRQYPATEHLVYMDVAARGLISREVRSAIDAHLEARMLHGVRKEEYFELVERTRSRFAQLINAHPDEVALAKNVSEGLNMVATSLPWQAGDNVIVCPELEHPNNVYCWLNLRRLGIEVRMVRPRDGHMPIDEIVQRIDGRTHVVTVSTVTFAPGFRTDVDQLGRACRERGVFFLVDAAQSCGVLHTDVVASNIDGLAVSTQKGLLGLYGMGFLYCRRAWAEQMHPAYLARFGVDVGEAHEAALGSDVYTLMQAARRFDLGNYNFLGCAAADAAMAQLLAYDIREIERYVVRLSHHLAQGFLELGLPVCGGTPGPHLAHIVSVGEMGTGSHYGTDDDRVNQLYTFLSEHEVRLSIRRGVLRFSLHVYNTRKDVERVLDLTQGWLRR